MVVLRDYYSTILKGDKICPLSHEGFDQIYRHLLCDLSLSLLSKYRFFTTNKSDPNLVFFQQRSDMYVQRKKEGTECFMQTNLGYSLLCCFESRAIFFSEDFKPFLLPLKCKPFHHSPDCHH